MGIGGFFLFWHLVVFILAHSGFPFFCIITFSPLSSYMIKKCT